MCMVVLHGPILLGFRLLRRSLVGGPVRRLGRHALGAFLHMVLHGTIFLYLSLLRGGIAVGRVRSLWGYALDALLRVLLHRLVLGCNTGTCDGGEHKRGKQAGCQGALGHIVLLSSRMEAASAAPSDSEHLRVARRLSAAAETVQECRRSPNAMAAR